MDAVLFFFLNFLRRLSHSYSSSLTIVYRIFWMYIFSISTDKHFYVCAFEAKFSLQVTGCGRILI